MMQKKWNSLFLSLLLTIPMMLTANEAETDKEFITGQIELSYLQLYDQISAELQIITPLQMFGFQIQRSLLSKIAKEKSIELFLRGVHGPASLSFLQTPCPFPQAFREYLRSGNQLMQTAPGNRLIYQELGARIGTIANTFGFSERDLSYLSQGLYLVKAPISLETFFNSLNTLPKQIKKREAQIARLLATTPEEEWKKASSAGKELLYLPLEALSREPEESFTLTPLWEAHQLHRISKESLSLLFPEVTEWLSTEKPQETLQFLVFLPVSSPLSSSLPLLLNYWPAMPVEPISEYEYEDPMFEDEPIVIALDEYSINSQDHFFSDDPIIIPAFDLLPLTKDE